MAKSAAPNSLHGGLCCMLRMLAPEDAFSWLTVLQPNQLVMDTA